MMVALLIAMVVAALGYVVYKRRSGVVAPSSADVKVSDEITTFGGIDFVVKTGTDSSAAAARGATAYDINDPVTAQRRLDAIARATNEENLAASKGTTVAARFAAKAAADAAANKATIDSATAFSAAHGGFTPKTNADLYVTLAAQTPAMGNVQPPGTYWDYGKQAWVPMIF